jgi:hypothetical protein
MKTSKLIFTALLYTLILSIVAATASPLFHPPFFDSNKYWVFLLISVALTVEGIIITTSKNEFIWMKRTFIFIAIYAVANIFRIFSAHNEHIIISLWLWIANINAIFVATWLYLYHEKLSIKTFKLIPYKWLALISLCALIISGTAMVISLW